MPADATVPPHPGSYTLRQIECFVGVAESKTIAGAAARLHASTSAVADAVTGLERALGVALFHRQRSRGVTLTTDGIAVLPAARRLLRDAEEVVALVGPGAGALTGTVRVGATPTLAPVVLAGLIADLQVTHPGLRVQLHVDDQPTLVAHLNDGTVDLLVSHDIDVPPELARARLYSTVACAVVAADHKLAGRDGVQLCELADEPMVLLDIAPSRVHTLELMSAVGVTPRIAYRTHNYELCRSLVGRGQGYTLLMRRAGSGRTWDGGEVVFLPISPAPRDVQVLVLWHKERASARSTAVVERLRVLGSEFTPMNSEANHGVSGEAHRKIPSGSEPPAG